MRLNGLFGAVEPKSLIGIPLLYGNEKSFNFSQMDRKDCLVFKDLAR